MAFAWLRPLGKWLLRAIVHELIDERTPSPLVDKPPASRLH